MSSTQTKFDYIIVGAGCAGLSLVMHMMQSSLLSQRKILLLDKSPKQANDRTWCFWQQKPGLFEPVVFHQWQNLWFHGGEWSGSIAIEPYSYKMIRGIDFYQYCLAELGRHSNVTVCFNEVEAVFSNEHETGVLVNGEKIMCDYVFNSVLFNRPRLKPNDYWLVQHFKGWLIETGEEVFNDAMATLMDFRVAQDNGTAFCYVLPLSGRRALVEYTVFSRELLDPGQYNKELDAYIRNILKIDDYNITDEEFGAIPMTNYQFRTAENRIIYIGTAGGQTKGSSGYTFSFIQKHSNAIVDALTQTGKPFTREHPGRFRFYDSVLLNILANNRLPASTIFTRMFRKNDPVKVLQFLDNETNLIDELKIISTLPVIPFTRAAISNLF